MPILRPKVCNKKYSEHKNDLSVGIYLYVKGIFGSIFLWH